MLGSITRKDSHLGNADTIFNRANGASPPQPPRGDDGFANRPS
jgi:hypothetical protein